jgi:hypothetical protein
MTVLTNKTLLTAGSASTNGPWYPLDYRLDTGGVIRSFTGTKAAADTIHFLVTNDDVRVTTENVSVFTTVSSFSEGTNFSYAFTGPWTAVRFIKTGTSGPATVRGIF